MLKFRQIVALLILCALLLQCSESSRPNQPDPTSDQPLRSPAEFTKNETSLLESANKFGLNLFREIARNTPATENIFISPLSVSYALGICYNGAAGDTRKAIGSTLQIADLSVDEMNQAYRDVTKILMQTDPMVEFMVANSFWSRQGKPIQSAFINMARQYFDARVEEIDFQADWAADTINAWVDRNTNGRISKMVTPPIGQGIAAILMNAIYFKGNWMFPFDTANTITDTFYLDDGSETECRMMRMREIDHAIDIGNDMTAPDTNATFFRNNDIEAVSLPYGRGDFRMTIMMPNQRNHPDYTIENVIDLFTWENWNRWLEGFRPEEFVIALPRFKFEYDVGLNEVLQTLGMEIAFDRAGADFSNMFVDGIGWIDEAMQKAFIQVDEEGTEAAAVTEIIIMDTGLPPELICDKPFLIVIHEDVSGAILFIGKISNPVWED